MTLVVGSAAVLAACSGLTDVTNLSVVESAALENIPGAVAQWAGAQKNFSSTAIRAIYESAVISDEWTSSDLPGNSYETGLDRRVPGTLNHETGGQFPNYSTNLKYSTFAIAALNKWAPLPGSRIAQLYAFKGYNEVFLGEQFCNGIPFSTIDALGNVNYGGPTSTIATFNRAIAHFDSAIAVSDSVRVTNFAKIGKARALINLGQYAAAATAVAGIPTTYVYNLEISTATGGTTNGTYTSMNGRAIGVPAGSDGINGINWLAAADPRAVLQTAGTGIGTDGKTRVYLASKYNSTAAPITFASGVEARLYEAEAALGANNNDAATVGTGWLGILNTLRTTAITPAMATLADPGSYNARVNLLFREKAFWKFLTSTRSSDLRRLVRQYGRAENTVWPTGLYHDGNQFGSETNVEPPIAESSNTNYVPYKSCIDHNA